jgi:hypothetical protein
MLARLIAAALAQRLVPPSGPLSPGAMNCESERSTHSPWSRFRMTLRGLHGTILGRGAWLLIQSESI